MRLALVVSSLFLYVGDCEIDCLVSRRLRISKARLSLTWWYLFFVDVEEGAKRTECIQNEYTILFIVEEEACVGIDDAL